MIDINIEKTRKLIDILDNKVNNDEEVKKIFKSLKKCKKYSIITLFLFDSIFFIVLKLLMGLDYTPAMVLALFIITIMIFPMAGGYWEFKKETLNSKKLTFNNDEFTQISNILDKKEFYDFLDKTETCSLSKWLDYLYENKEIISQIIYKEEIQNKKDEELKNIQTKKEQKILYVENLYKDK